MLPSSFHPTIPVPFSKDSLLPTNVPGLCTQARSEQKAYAQISYNPYRLPPTSIHHTHSLQSPEKAPISLPQPMEACSSVAALVWLSRKQQNLPGAALSLTFNVPHLSYKKYKREECLENEGKDQEDWQDEEEKTLQLKEGSHWVTDTVTLGLGEQRDESLHRIRWASRPKRC